MVWLLACCCAPALNWVVICYSGACLSAVTMQGNHWGPRSSKLCCEIADSFVRMILPTSMYLRVHPWHSGPWKSQCLHDFWDGVITICPCWNALRSFILLMYCVWLLLILWAALLILTDFTLGHVLSFYMAAYSATFA